MSLAKKKLKVLKRRLPDHLAIQISISNEIINNTVDINELDEALDALDLDDTELAEAEAAAAKEQQEQEQQN